MIEQLSSNTCFVNEHCLRNGFTRRLQHGDHISLCMYAHETRDKPFAAFVFQVATEADNAKCLGSRIAAVARPTRYGGDLLPPPQQSRHPKGKVAGKVGTGAGVCKFGEASGLQLPMAVAWPKGSRSHTVAE